MVWLKTKDFFLLHETKIILLLGFILVAILSFEAGLLKGKNITQNPVVVNAASCQNSDIALAEAPEGQNQPQERSDAQTGDVKPGAGCAFVGSKNSNKFHLPVCRWAKNIKSENRVCFKDQNEAQLKGYQADKNCVK